MIKIERTTVPPLSLAVEKTKSSGKYNCEDVVNQLHKDFHGKCYICEMKPVYDINIEHLNPHKGNLNLKFDWNNLFYSCAHCNNMKNRAKYENKILDCCRLNPEEFMYHIFENEHVFVKPIDEYDSDETVCMTAELITDCFESHSTPIRIKQCEARVSELKITMLSLYKTLEEFSENPHGRALNALRGMLSRTYKFAGFTRTYVRMHLKEYPELKQYVA